MSPDTTTDTTIRSRAYYLPSSDIDTDQVLPSRFQQHVDGTSDLSPYFFHDRRFDAAGNPVAGFALNDPALKGARIIVAPSNYACGSARAGAIFAHVDFGIRILISESFGPVFPTVSYKFGLIAIELPKHDMDRLIRVLTDDPLAEIEVDLERQEIRAGQGTPLPFGLDEYVRFIALSGKDEIGFTRTHEAAIDDFEQQRRQELPWLFA